MIALIFLLILSIAAAVYLGYRAYYLAGTLADAQEYIEELEVTNQYMYQNIVAAYDSMKEIDGKGSFAAEDEVGTTFNMLLQTVTQLKETFDGETSEEKK